jgi:hypothetical protein
LLRAPDAGRLASMVRGMRAIRNSIGDAASQDGASAVADSSRTDPSEKKSSEAFE